MYIYILNLIEIPRNLNSVLEFFFKKWRPLRVMEIQQFGEGKSVGLNRGQDSAKNNEVGNLHDSYDNIITFYILYEGCSKNKVTAVFSKNTYLLINIYVVPFKVIPVRYNTLVPALFPIIEALLIIILRYNLEFFQRCSFYLLNR